jgi:hypothetical protein
MEHTKTSWNLRKVRASPRISPSRRAPTTQDHSRTKVATQAIRPAEPFFFFFFFSSHTKHPATKATSSILFCASDNKQRVEHWGICMHSFVTVALSLEETCHTSRLFQFYVIFYGILSTTYFLFVGWSRNDTLKHMRFFSQDKIFMVSFSKNIYVLEEGPSTNTTKNTVIGCTLLEAVHLEILLDHISTAVLVLNYCW